MLSNRRMGMVGFLEHSFFGLIFLAFFIFIGLPFAAKNSTHWAISFLIYMLTVGNIMYIFTSLSAYGKSMLTNSNFDVDIGEMYNIVSGARISKILFTALPLAIVGLILSPLAFITMILNIKTFFKRNEEYLEAIDEEWERREKNWDLETEEIEKKEKEKAIQRKEQKKLEKEKNSQREQEEKNQAKLKISEKEKVIDTKEIKLDNEKQKEKIVGHISCYIDGWDTNVRYEIYFDGKQYFSTIGKWSTVPVKAETFDILVRKIEAYYKEKYEKFSTIEIKRY